MPANGSKQHIFHLDNVLSTSNDHTIPHLFREPLRFKGFVSLVDLRRASILIVLSLLPLPLQFPSSQSQVIIFLNILMGLNYVCIP